MSMKVCLNCGSELPEGAKFCASCGAAVPVGDEAAPVNLAKPYTPPTRPASAPYKPPTPTSYTSPVSYASPAAGAYRAPAAGKVSPIMIIGMILSFTVFTFGLIFIAWLDSDSFGGGAVLCLLLSVGGIVMSSVGRAKSTACRGMGTAGLVIGIISSVFFTILTIDVIF